MSLNLWANRAKGLLLKSYLTLVNQLLDLSNQFLVHRVLFPSRHTLGPPILAYLLSLYAFLFKDPSDCVCYGYFYILYTKLADVDFQPVAAEMKSFSGTLVYVMLVTVFPGYVPTCLFSQLLS